VLTGGNFAIEREEKKMTRQPKWTLDECAAAVALYFQMRHKVDAGDEYNKAAMIRQFRGESDQWTHDSHAPCGNAILRNRSRGSIEAKLMNVTAVLHDLGREDVSMAEYGYRPLSNYQADLKTMVVGLIAVRDEAVAGGFSA
jgi:hypothetical protein